MKFAFTLALAICLQIGAITSGFCQGAWTSPKGTGWFAISYQNALDGKHSFDDGRNFMYVFGQKVTDAGTMRFQSVFLDFGYSITDKLAVSFQVPFVQGKYNKPETLPVNPNTGQPVVTFGPHWVDNGAGLDPGDRYTIPIDDGNYHGGFQDLGFRLRYNVITEPFALTPFIQYNVPSHGYPYYSHAVIGSRLAELQIGSYMGKFLSPSLYLAGGYGFGWQQRILDISKKKHHFEIETGYFINDGKMKVFGILIGQKTIGGLDLNQDPASFNKGPVFMDFGPPDSSLGYTSGNEKFMHHVQIGRDDLYDVSVGMQYSVNARLDVYGAVVHTLWSRNFHEHKYALTFGFSWGFGGDPQRPCHC